MPWKRWGGCGKAYSGSVGYEDGHIQNPEEREWLQDAAESREFFQNFTAEEKRAVLKRLSEVEGLEKFLHTTFVGAKRFSIEGVDALVPMLDRIVHEASAAHTHEVVMGMAHRGRLNVLAHILGKPYTGHFAGVQVLEAGRRLFSGGRLAAGLLRAT